MEIKGCIAVVTGGASGLGEASVRTLINEGARAAILDFDEERGTQLAAELGDSVVFYKTDITDENAVQDAIEKGARGLGLVTGEGKIETDIIIFALGVKPNTRLASEAGLATGNSGAIS